MSLKLQKLRQQIEEEELDAILISAPENRRYMSGFAGSAGWLLISPDDATLATDFRYVEQAGNQAPDFSIYRIQRGLGWFPEWTAEHGVKRIGFESQDVTVSVHNAFLKAIEEAEDSNNPELVPTSGIVEKLRVFKDADELALLTEAIRIADEAIDEIAPRIEPGITEEAVAWELEKAMRERGAEMISFDTIVGAAQTARSPITAQTGPSSGKMTQSSSTWARSTRVIAATSRARYLLASRTTSSARYTTSCCKPNSPPKSRLRRA